MTLQEFAIKTNMDLEGTMARFANMEALVRKFLKKFPDDPSFKQLSQAVEENNHEVIERASHTLKGVAGNLGFMELFDVNQKIVDAVRSGNYDEIPVHYEADRKMYENIIECLKQLQ